MRRRSARRRRAFRSAAVPDRGHRVPVLEGRPSTISTACGRAGSSELELLKRASLTGTGTCQGGVCVPHLRAYIADTVRRGPGAVHRPAGDRARSRSPRRRPTSTSTSSGARRCTTSTSPLGGRLDRFGGWWRPWNYGDHVAEYWAVREAVSLGDVSTLGKLLVSGPDVVELLERLYPTTSPTSSPAARATCCCSTSAATSSTTA